MLPLHTLAQTAPPVVERAAEKIEQTAIKAETWLAQAQAQAVAYAPKVIGALLVVFAAWIVAGWARRVVRTIMTRASIDVTLIGFLSNAVRYAILVMGVLACLSTFGLEVTSFIAILSAISLAIGLAFQGTLSHLAAGIMLLIFRPFKVGDVVNIGGQTGVVDEIELFSTSLDTPDRKRIIIPNGAIYGTTITNFTHHPTRVAAVRVPISLSAEPEQIRATLRSAGEALASRNLGTVEGAKPGVGLAEVNAGAQVWVVSLACQTPRLDAVTEELTLAAGRAVAQAGINPPAPVSLIKNV